MNRNDCAKGLVQVAAIASLICSAHARADDCAGGMDATGNACNGDQAVRRISEAESKMLYLKGAAIMAALRSTEAKQRQSAANAEVKTAEASLKASLKALSDAEKSARH